MQNSEDWYLIYRCFGGTDDSSIFHKKLNTIREGFVHEPFTHIKTKDERIIELMAALSMDCAELNSERSATEAQ